MKISIQGIKENKENRNDANGSTRGNTENAIILASVWQQSLEKKDHILLSHWSAESSIETTTMGRMAR